MLILQRRSRRHLSLCGVRCNTGTDELLYPSIFTAAIKSTCIRLKDNLFRKDIREYHDVSTVPRFDGDHQYKTFVALFSAIHLHIHQGCPFLSIPILLSVSLIGFMVLQFSAIVNDLVIIGISAAGSLKNYAPRQKIEYFLYIGWFIYVVEICWDAFSTYTIFSPPVATEHLQNCSSYSTSLIIYKVVVLSHWALLIISFSLFTFLFDPLNCCLLSARFNDIEQSIDESESGGGRSKLIGVHRNPFSCATWCQCCNRGGVASNRNNALRDLVHVFRVIFDGLETEYTFLDLVAGFRLQLTYHSRLRDGGRDPTQLIRKKTIDILSRDEGYSEPTPPKQLLPNELLQYSRELQFYLKYAMAAYGWPIQVYLKPVKGPASLCINARCSCCCARCQEPHFEGNSCFPNQAAIKAMTGVQVDDIIDASFVNLVHIVPFYVVKLEREGRKELVIAVRGTLSIKDALTDASARMREIPGGLLGVTPAFIHRGIYQAAVGVYDHIMRNETFTDLASKQEYKLVITGHSLGAGVASVLAVMFKEQHPEWSSDLVAYNFATPPVFSYALAERSQSFITTVVSGYDIVPRMTIRGLGHLLLSVRDLLDNTEDTKQSVLCCVDCQQLSIDQDTIYQRQMDTLLNLDVKRPGTVDNERGRSNDVATETVDGDKKKGKFKFGRHLLDRLAKLVVMEREKRRERDSSEQREEDTMMFAPGRIIHLEVEKVDRLKRWCSCGLKKAAQVKASWKSREDLSGIQVHSSMLLDHGPTRTIDFVNTLSNQLLDSQEVDEQE